MATPTHIWPRRTWPLAALTEAQWARWESDGYLIIPDAVPLSLARAASAAVRAYVGAEDGNKSSWYANTLDIYEDLDADGLKPHHGPCGMAQMFHHSSLWALRQHPRLHSIFADLYGTRRLYVTADRAHFKPPQSDAYPAWSDPGPVHVGLHWDVDTRPSNWPVPYVMQGVVYLEDTAADQGALRVVPGFHTRLAAWSATQPANRSAERPTGAAAETLAAEAAPLEGKAGSLVVWHSLLPHGPAPNVGSAPRVSAYVTMLPVDAAPFLGPRRLADAPLGMSDAGTLAYLPDMPLPEGYIEEAHGEAEAHGGAEGKGSPVAEEAQCEEASPPSAGLPAPAAPGFKRQSRERRAERWRHRLPLLDEDPTEAQLSRRPPGEEDGEPAHLTPLGQRLVGLVEWEADPEANLG